MLQISGRDFHDSIAMKKKFNKITKLLNELEVNIEEKIGLGFVSKHRYSKEALCDSPIFSQVYAVIGSIDDDVKNWTDQDKISDEVLNEYKERREGAQKRIDQLQQAIIERKDSKIEKIIAWASFNTLWRKKKEG